VLSRNDASGRPVSYLAPRILPQGSAVSGETATSVLANEVDRLDLIAFRTLRDPARAWQIADANDAMDPFELCRAAGAIVRLPGTTP
jgi:hypothetical protein